MPRLTAILVLLLLVLPAGASRAESFPVTNTDDHGGGSLRAAIGEANSFDAGEDDRIPIEVGGVIELDTKLPAITGSTRITGPGALALEIGRAAAADDFRIFETGPFTNVSFAGLTVRDGVAQIGAGIYSSGELVLDEVIVIGNEAIDSGGEDAFARGGGVFSTGWLTVRDSVFRDNRAIARGGTNETAALGGGLAATSQLAVERSTFAANVAEAHAEGGAEAFASGGGVDFQGHGEFLISTFSGNAALADGGFDLNSGSGGGIRGQEAQIIGLTLTGNSASTEGSNLDSSFYSLVRNTIFAHSQGEANSCNGTILSDGFNLDEDGSCGFGKSSDLVGVAAGLDPVLKDNGGPTPTHALLEGSIAIDRGNSFGASTDQRGLPRPADFPAISNKEGGDGSDIGAFELQVPPGGSVPPAPPILVGTEPGDRTPPQTRIVSGPARVGYERKAKFRFNSSEGQSSFECKLDKKKWRTCRSPYKLKVKPGKHLLKVRAIDRFGNADPSPARFSWRVKPVG